MSRQALDAELERVMTALNDEDITGENIILLYNSIENEENLFSVPYFYQNEIINFPQVLLVKHQLFGANILEVVIKDYSMFSLEYVTQLLTLLDLDYESYLEYFRTYLEFRNKSEESINAFVDSYTENKILNSVDSYMLNSLINLNFKKYLQDGGRINEVKFGITPLELASLIGSSRDLEFLLKNGADVKIFVVFPPLMMLDSGEREKFTLLLKSGAGTEGEEFWYQYPNLYPFYLIVDAINLDIEYLELIKKNNLHKNFLFFLLYHYINLSPNLIEKVVEKRLDKIDAERLAVVLDEWIGRYGFLDFFLDFLKEVDILDVFDEISYSYPEVLENMNPYYYNSIKDILDKKRIERARERRASRVIAKSLMAKYYSPMGDFYRKAEENFNLGRRMMEERKFR